MQLTAEIRKFIEVHKNDDVRLLALQGGRYPEIDMKKAIIQIAGRQAIAGKLPSWNLIEALLYPSHLPLEQCSSEITARYKASLCKGHKLVDLTGGFGVDCVYMSSGFHSVDYVERQEELCKLAQHNFPLLGANHIHIHNNDGIDFLQNMQESADCIFIDPARRSRQGHKTVLLEDCEPDVRLLDTILLTKAQKVIIKLSPMLDVSLALRELNSVTEVHILSIDNDCKELLLVLEKANSSSVTIHCINFTGENRQEFIFNREKESQISCIYTKEIDKFLYEPNASVLKAGAYKTICHTFPVKKFHPSSHLYTSANLISNFPGRIFRVIDYSFIKDKSLLTDITQANITVRNFPLSAEQLRKRLKLKDGGDTYFFATTLADNSRVLIKCGKVNKLS